MYWTRFQERSSVRTNTTFGRAVAAVDGVVEVDRVDGVDGVDGGLLEPRQAAADAEMIRISTPANHL
jgi:hypothetical protein